jgi:hypothetical protein
VLKLHVKYLLQPLWYRELVRRSKTSHSITSRNLRKLYRLVMLLMFHLPLMTSKQLSWPQAKLFSQHILLEMCYMSCQARLPPHSSGVADSHNMVVDIDVSTW